MTRYTIGQGVFAFVLAGLGAVKAVRITFDSIDDALSNLAGLS